MKILLPLAAIVIVLLLCKYKYRYSLKEDMQLRAPAAGPFVLWVAIAIVWMLVTDAIIGWRGPWDFTVWKTQALYVSVIRVIAVCVLGPVAEELIFRGLLFRKLTRSGKFPLWLAVAILALAWALMHYSYTPAVIFIIFVEGLLLGAALIHSRSLFVPIAMHVAWNLYAVW